MPNINTVHVVCGYKGVPSRIIPLTSFTSTAEVKQAAAGQPVLGVIGHFDGQPTLDQAAEILNKRCDWRRGIWPVGMEQFKAQILFSSQYYDARGTVEFLLSNLKFETSDPESLQKTILDQGFQYAGAEPPKTTLFFVLDALGHLPEETDTIPAAQIISQRILPSKSPDFGPQGRGEWPDPRLAETQLAVFGRVYFFNKTSWADSFVETGMGRFNYRLSRDLLDRADTSYWRTNILFGKAYAFLWTQARKSLADGAWLQALSECQYLTRAEKKELGDIASSFGESSLLPLDFAAKIGQAALILARIGDRQAWAEAGVVLP